MRRLPHRFAAWLASRLEGRHVPYWPLPGKPSFSYWNAGDRRVEPADVLVVPARLVQALILAVEQDGVSCGGAGRAVVVWSLPHQVQLAEDLRDRLWALFEVPIFQQVAAPDGRPLAYECEARAGLHLIGSQGDLEGCPGILETAPCECGRAGARLVPQPQVLHASAAD